MDNSGLPPGLTFDKPPAAPDPLPPPAAELPQGLSFDPPKGALPPGLSFDNPLQPAKDPPAPPPPPADGEVPGFWDSAGSAFSRGLYQRTADDVAGVKTILPAGLGGQTLEEQFQQGKMHPQTKDEVDRLTEQPISEGWSDPRWWGTHIAGGIGGAVPGMGAAALGALVRINPAASFGLEAGLGSVVPAYNKARSAGLDPDSAATRAMVDSGIAATFGVASGIMPQVALFGRMQNPAVVDQIASVLKRPFLESLAQIGLVQPGLAVTQGAATAVTHGEMPNADQALGDFVSGVGMGAVMHVGTHGIVKAGETLRTSTAATEPPATPEQILKSYENQNPNITVRGETSPQGQFETPPEIRVGPPFYSAVTEAINKKVPENASASQVLSTLRNTVGVKEQEINDLKIPSYLASAEGVVNKQDLLAHVEANAVDLKEVEFRESLPPHLRNALENWHDDMELQYGPRYLTRMTKEELAVGQRIDNEIEDFRKKYRVAEFANQVAPGPHSNYREFVMHSDDPGQSARIEARAEAEYNQIYGDQVKDGSVPPFARQSKVVRARYLAGPRDALTYSDTHWPGINNPIVHIRTTDRQGANGEHLLHAEEIQSTGHQAGAKQGYRDPNIRSYAEIEKDRRQLRPEFDAMREKYKDYGTDDFVRNPMAPEDVALMHRMRGLNAEWQAAVQNEQVGRVPDMPFKTNWQELAVKRLLRLAADEGYDGVSWANGDQVALRLNPDQLAGARLNYDKKIPAIFAKWAKKLGSNIEQTKFEGINPSDAIDNYPQPIRSARTDHYQEMGFYKEFDNRNYFVRAHPAFSERVRLGLPLYDKDVQAKGTKTLSDLLPKGAPEKLAKAAVKIDQIYRKLASEMKVTRGVTFNVQPMAHAWRGRLRPDLDPTTGNYVIDVNTNRIATPEDLYASMGHEFGHVVEHNLYETASDAEKAALDGAFKRFRAALPPGDITVGDVRRLRDNAVSEMSKSRAQHNDYRLSDLEPRSKAYLLHQGEWFAEQVAKWVTTNQRPMGIVEGFFKSLATKLKKVLGVFAKERGMEGSPDKVVEDFLNSRFDSQTPWIGPIKEQFDLDTTRKNADAMDRDGTPEIKATPQTDTTGGGRNIVDSLPPSAKGGGNSMAAHGDRMNRFYEWMTSLPQIAELNKHIRGLQMYKEIVSLMNLEKNQVMGDAWQRLRQWKAIKDPKQLFGLNKFIEDYANGMFKQVDDGQIRRPTQPEFEALVKKHGLSDKSLGVFNGLVQDFDGFLEKYRGLLISDANRIKDPTAKLAAVQQANARIDTMKQRPFFPLTRFGKYTVTVYDSKGNVRHLEQTDSLRQQKQVAEVLSKSKDLLPGDRVQVGVVPKDAAPLLGMPPGFVDLIANKLALSKTQQQVLDQMRFDYAPSQSFKHQFRQKEVTPGYSTDFQRSYAHFFFHGANHVTRIKWVDALRDQIRDVRTGAIGMNDAIKRGKIANYMTEHLEMLVDPKPDFAALRGLMFHWFLGFNPASATLNLSQTPIMTYPHLASKFGDIKSVWAMGKAAGDLNNFYKKSSIQELAKSATPGPEGSKLRALNEAIKEGVISETQAHTLAAVSEDRNTLRVFGSKGEEGWNKFSEASSWMFEMTEQYNRRVAFRAGWDLAMREPNNKYVQETVRDNPLQYQRLKQQGWSDQEAAAFTAAKDSVEKTQFVYAPFSRPKFMWGRKGALFIFKSFVQNSLFNLWNNPQMAARSLLIMGALGGLMGLPGTENVNSMLKALAWKLFGKDFDLQDEARKFAVDVTGGAINPDLLLHGMSVHGFGIPAVMNGMGNFAGLNNFFPTFDRSKSISMGDVLGADPFAPFQPTKDPKGAEFQQLQRAAGAGFGNIFALYNFLSSQDNMSTLKGWEQIMPRWMSNMSHAWRYATQQKETNAAGNTIARFDPSDTMQMAEILGRAMGYQPRRLTAQWEKIQAEKEASTYWDLRRGILMKQFGSAIKSGDTEENKAKIIQSVKNFNSELPPEAKAKAITSQVLKESVGQRVKAQAKTELGIAQQKSNIQLYKEVDKYYPEGKPPGLVGARGVQ